MQACPTPACFAGHSMGQYSAMVAAGVLELARRLRLVRERGRLMQASSPDGAMAAIIGLDDDAHPGARGGRRGAGVFTVANRNSPGQIVVSGERAAVEAAAEAARDLGAKRAIVLPVSVAAHSPLMAARPRACARRSPTSTFARPGRAAPRQRRRAPADHRRGLPRGARRAPHARRRLGRAVETMAAAGRDTFVEVGPGKVLTGLIRRIAPEARTLALDDLTTADGRRRPHVPADQPATTE